ncbi:MAG: DUF2235 domain-containing protein [Pseudomonadota bacterium]|nr:DUF2235 domain-containing protein [Pseudomonadota bacterium]
MYKYLIICIDGTWNDKSVSKNSMPTNVATISELFEHNPSKQEQIVEYISGVGTGGWWDNKVAGIYGNGITERISKGYRFLCENYEPGDRIALFGFSRGAFAVRALIGMLTVIGVLEEDKLHLIDAAIARYRNPFRSRTNDFPAYPVNIHFVGLWDTVVRFGPLLTPIRLFMKSIFKRPFGLHDNYVPHTVRYAYHALALDETRHAFLPTRLIDLGVIGAEEVWFSGAHADVGGGYTNSRAASIPLTWMVEKAMQSGLVFTHVPDSVEVLTHEDIHDPRDNLKWKLLPMGRRSFKQGDVVHKSVMDLLLTGTYTPKAKGVITRRSNKE